MATNNIQSNQKGSPSLALRKISIYFYSMHCSVNPCSPYFILAWLSYCPKVLPVQRADHRSVAVLFSLYIVWVSEASLLYEASSKVIIMGFDYISSSWFDLLHKIKDPILLLMDG